MAGNPFDFTNHMNQGPAQTTGSGGGGGKSKRKNKKPNRPNRNPGGGGGGGNKPPPPSDADAWEDDFWMDQPQEAFTGFAGEQGFNMQGSDALANWMNAQYEPLYTDWQAGLADYDNREQTFQDYLSGLGGADGVRQDGPQPLQPLAGPQSMPGPSSMLGLKTGRVPRIPGPSRPAESGPGSGFYDEMMRRYQMSTLESKGLNYSPYEGFSRWLAF